VVEGARLESVFRGNSNVGSNPTLSAICRVVQVTLSAAKIGARVELHMKRPIPVESASALIDQKIKELGDWRGKTLAKVREIIHEADPEIVEESKWMGLPSGPRRHCLHRRDVQEGRQDDICEGSCVEGPFRQLQPRRECQARFRHPRRRKGR
jgi:hypothetical protein